MWDEKCFVHCWLNGLLCEKSKSCILRKTSLSWDESSWTWPHALIRHQGDTREGGSFTILTETKTPCFKTPPRDTLSAVDACPLLETIAGADMTGPSTHVFIQASISISLQHISRYDKISSLYVSEFTSAEQRGQLCKVSGPLINDRCAVSSRGLLTHPVFVRKHLI